MAISLRHSASLTHVQGHISFTLEELDGVPQGVISGHGKRDENGKTIYDVKFKTPDIFPIVRFPSSSLPWRPSLMQSLSSNPCTTPRPARVQLKRTKTDSR